MKKISMPDKDRRCPHCKKNLLAYYHEDNQTGCDLYYCTFCFRLVIWDGKRVESCDGEAYPDREKL